MRRELLLLCLLLICFKGISQYTSITYYNSNWKTTKAEKAFYTLKEFKYEKDKIYVEYFDNSGKLIVSGYYKDNYMDSIWLVYNSKKEKYDTLDYIGIKDLYLETANEHPFSEIFIIVEQMPIFGRGIKDNNDEFRDYIMNNLHYPIRAVQNKIEGKVYITFIVGPDGKIYAPKKVLNADKDLTFETLRVIRNSPIWQPGKQRNKEVAVQFTMPIVFVLN